MSPQAAAEILRLTALDGNLGTDAAKAIDAAFCKYPTWPEFSMAAWSNLVGEVARCASYLPTGNAEAWAWVARQALELSLAHSPMNNDGHFWQSDR